MRALRGQKSLWRWWWPLGGVVGMGFIALGLAVGWSGALWAAAGVAAVVYVGVPVAAESLIALAGSRKNSSISGTAETKSNYPPLTDHEKEEEPGSPAQIAIGDADAPKTRSAPVKDNKAVYIEEARREVYGMPTPSPVLPPSSEFLQQRIRERSGWALQSPDSPRDRPWRRVGSEQFAALVQALAVALPSVDTADDVAGLAGVRRHMIRRGRDTPKQRWQAVLEQGINDNADDLVCGEALELNDPQELRVAVAEWLGVSSG